jgi:transmembrane sensor
MNEKFGPVRGQQDAVRDLFLAAAHWHGLHEQGELQAQERERFHSWLAADPSHRKAYQSVEHAWAGMANAGLDEGILLMRREALAAPPNTRVRWNRRAGIAASILAGAVIAGAFMRHNPPGANPSVGEFSTQVGQRSNITLADGSVVVLNTASRIEVAYDAQVRRVQLLAGQAWFEVAKHQPRPFVVEAGNQRVTAHGTAFDVRLEEHDQVQVTLAEGRVSVEALKSAGAGPDIPVSHEDLLPGDQLVVSVARPAIKHKADVAKATIWREGQIIFDDDTLEKAVTEVNRYSTRKIVLADPRLASLRMSGVFIAGHSESFLETVTGHFPIKVTGSADGPLLLTAAE